MTVENDKIDKFPKKLTAEQIVSRYIRGEYKSIEEYAKDFKKAHSSADLYEMCFGHKLED